MEEEEEGEEGWDVLMVGSSLMESWRGTRIGREEPARAETHEVWERYFASPHVDGRNLRSHVLAISGTSPVLPLMKDRVVCQ